MVMSSAIVPNVVRTMITINNNHESVASESITLHTVSQCKVCMMFTHVPCVGKSYFLLQLHDGSQCKSVKLHIGMYCNTYGQ